MEISKIMTKFDDMVTINHEESVETAISKMVDHGIGSVVVIKDGEVFGIVTSSDILKILNTQQSDAFKLPTGSITQRDLETIRPDVPLNIAIQKMADIQTHHLLVSYKSRIVGLLSSFDIVREKALDSKSHPWTRS